MNFPEIFDGEYKSINLFNNNMSERVKISGWIDTGENIIMIEDANETCINLVTGYGIITMEYIGAIVKYFIGQQTHQSQNSVQIFHCLTNSMAEAAYPKIVAKPSKYMDGDTPVDNLLFKLRMKKAIIDTRATKSHIWENLTNLDTYISTVNSNIKNFNHYVKVKLDVL